MSALLTASFFLFLFSLQLFAADKCQDLFLKKNSPTFASRSRNEITRIENLDVIIRKEVESELALLSSKEVEDIRTQTAQLQDRITEMRFRIAINSELNGSDRLRIDVEATNRAKGWMYKLKAGAVNALVKSVGPFFGVYEVSYLRLHDSLQKIQKLKENPDVPAAEINAKEAEITKLEKFVGKNYFNYVSLRHLIDRTKESRFQEHTLYAEEALAKLYHVSAVEAAQYKLQHRKIELQEIYDFMIKNKNANYAMLKRALWEERWMSIKLLFLSGPMINFVKRVLYKLPPEIKGVKLRDPIADLVGLSRDQHGRDLYLEKLEEILELDGHPEEQYRRLRTLNASSEKKDDLLVLFARIPENVETWYAIKKVAAKQAKQNAILENFYKRMEAAEKQALLDGDFPLYHQQPGISKIVKVAFGTWATAAALNAHPEFIDSLVTVIKSPLQLFGL